jgi:hypothetical protein
MFTSALWQELDAVENLRLSNRGDPQARTGSLFYPSNHRRGRFPAHKLGNNVRIEQNHLRNVGGFRISSRFGTGSSTP